MDMRGDEKISFNTLWAIWGMGYEIGVEMKITWESQILGRGCGWAWHMAGVMFSMGPLESPVHTTILRNAGICVESVR
jgi:hypothetical protein